MGHYKDGSYYTISDTEVRFLNCDRFFPKVQVLGVLPSDFGIHKLELWLSLDVFLCHFAGWFFWFIDPYLFKIKELINMDIFQAIILIPPHCTVNGLKEWLGWRRMHIRVGNGENCLTSHH